MPLVRISLKAGKTAEYKSRLGDEIHEAMVKAINCPLQDRFQLITELSQENSLHTPEFLGIKYSDELVMIQIFLNEGRTTDLKKALYQEIAIRLNQALAIRIQDVLINLVEVKKENWSFGNGIAQYA